MTEYRCPGTDVRTASFTPDDVCFVCGYLKEAHTHYATTSNNIANMDNDEFVAELQGRVDYFISQAASAGAALESMAWLISVLKGPCNAEVIAHLEGVRDFVKARYLLDMMEMRAKQPKTLSEACASGNHYRCDDNSPDEENG